MIRALKTLIAAVIVAVIVWFVVGLSFALLGLAFGY